MDYSNLITRNSYEKIARGLGIVNVANLSFAALETIVSEAQARQREEYKKMRDNDKVPHSNILVDNLDANAAAVYPCDYCDGEGRVEEVLGNSPYTAVVDCEVCLGMGELEMHTVALMREAA